MPFCLKSAFACWISYKTKRVTNDNDDDNNRSNMLFQCSILDNINTLNVKEFGYWHKKLFLQLSNNLTILTRLSLFCAIHIIGNKMVITYQCHSTGYSQALT